jgi:proline iminopeptidase
MPNIVRARIELEDGSLFCEQEGAGTPLVLIAGGPGCTHHTFHPSFSVAANFCRVIYYDQRGTGDSTKALLTSSYTIDQAILDLELLRLDLQLPKMIVLGHSYGGLLAQIYALSYPDRVLGMVLVTSKPGLPDIEMLPNRQCQNISQEEKQRIREIIRNGQLTDQQRTYHAFIAGDWKRQNFRVPSQDRLLRLYYEWKPAQGFNEAMGNQADLVDLHGKFHDLHIPTLIIESRQDLTWHDSKMDALIHNHPRASLAIFEKSAHSPFRDEEAKFFSILRDFVVTCEKHEIS